MSAPDGENVLSARQPEAVRVGVDRSRQRQPLAAIAPEGASSTLLRVASTSSLVRRTMLIASVAALPRKKICRGPLRLP